MARVRPQETRRVADAIWGDRPPGSPLIAPLVVGDEHLGLIAALVPSVTLPDAQSALSAAAAHVAVAIRQHELIDRLKEENLVKEFFEALARGDAPREELERTAARLGCDLDAPHLVLHAAPWAAAGPARRRSRRREPGTHERPPWPELAGRWEPRLVAALPGVLVDRREASIRALVPLASASEEGVDAVRQAYADIAQGDREALAVGLSNVCRGPAAFPRGFEEALQAAEVGALIRGVPDVTGTRTSGRTDTCWSEDEARDRTNSRWSGWSRTTDVAGPSCWTRWRRTRKHEATWSELACALHPPEHAHGGGRAGATSRRHRPGARGLVVAGVAMKVVKLGQMREDRTQERRGNDG